MTEDKDRRHGQKIRTDKERRHGQKIRTKTEGKDTQTEAEDND